MFYLLLKDASSIIVLKEERAACSILNSSFTTLCLFYATLQIVNVHIPLKAKVFCTNLLHGQNVAANNCVHKC